MKWKTGPKKGASYQGTWKNGQLEGNGKYTYPNGDVYEGTFKEDKMDGFGTFTSKGGE